MTPPPNSANYFGPQAYRSNQIPTMPAQAYGYNVMGYQRLPWGNVKKDFIPSSKNKASVLKIKDEKARLDRYGLAIPREAWGTRNHEYMEDANVGWLPIIIGYGYATGKIMAWPATAITLLIFISDFFSLRSSKGDLLVDCLIFSFLFPALPGIFFYMWGGFRYLIYKKPELMMKKGQGPKWRLNRRTGMVTQWRYPKTPTELVQVDEYPFTHLDAYILKMMTQGGMIYKLLLHNRYTDKVFRLNNFVGDSSESGVVNYWSFIQNYMDTSKPLPEYTEFEFYRHLDPVTAEYDQKTGRNPRQFRDLTPQQWKDFDKLFTGPWDDYRTRPCAFQEGGYVHYLPTEEWHPKPTNRTSSLDDPAA